MIEDPEGPHPHHGSTGIKWLDLALALAVVALSGASLITAQHTGQTMERLVDANSRLVRANATPILQFATGNVQPPSTRAITFELSNVGTGTARLIWFELALDGKAMPNINTLIGYTPRAAEHDYITTNQSGGTYVPAGERRLLITWPYPSSPAAQTAWDRLDHARARLKPSACFCSVLGECWTSHLGADLPQPVASCDVRGHLGFYG